MTAMERLAELEARLQDALLRIATLRLRVDELERTKGVYGDHDRDVTGVPQPLRKIANPGKDDYEHAA